MFATGSGGAGWQGGEKGVRRESRGGGYERREPEGKIGKMERGGKIMSRRRKGLWGGGVGGGWEGAREGTIGERSRQGRWWRREWEGRAGGAGTEDGEEKSDKEVLGGKGGWNKGDAVKVRK